MNICTRRYNALKVATILILPFLMAGALYGQLSVKISEHVRCQNTQVLVPVEVTDFDDIAAITLQIGIDTLKTRFLSVENIHPALAGGSVVYNFVASSSSIFITWQSLNAASIGTGTLFDLKLDYYVGDAELNFGEICEIVLSDLTIVEAQLGDGIIHPALQIEEQPQPLTVVEGEEAQFTAGVGYPDVHQYLWQQHDGNAWNALSNNEIFSGVATPVLTIDSVPVVFNHYAFRCLIAYDDCSKMTDSAELVVTPLTVISPQQQTTRKKLELYPNPCQQVINYTLAAKDQDYSLQLYSLLGSVVRQQPVTEAHGTIFLDDVLPGLYLMQLLHHQQPIETIKVIVR